MSAEVTPPKKLRAIVYGAGMGMFPPLMKRFQEEFEIVATLSPYWPPLFRLACLIRAVRWPRAAWYRSWRHYVEKTPISFRVLTRESARLLAPYEGQYDIILFLGAVYRPSEIITKPLFQFTDFCRRLSSLNPYDEVSKFKDAKEEREWLALEGGVYHAATRTFTGSEFVKQGLVKYYGIPPEKVVPIGFGAGLGFGEAYEKTFDGRSILYIGKGDFEKKGGLVLLKAFEQVRREIPDAILHIVGQDTLPPTPGVINHGFTKDRQKIVDLMRSAHVLTLPSLVDRFGIVLVEAMAANTPCVASDYAAMPEVVGDAGLIVPCNDADALAKALLSILRDEQLSRRLGAAGRRRFETHYNWDSIWEVVRAEIYRGLGLTPAARASEPAGQESMPYDSGGGAVSPGPHA